MWSGDASGSVLTGDEVHLLRIQHNVQFTFFSSVALCVKYSKFGDKFKLDSYKKML